MGYCKLFEINCCVVFPIKGCSESGLYCEGCKHCDIEVVEEESE